MRTMDEVLASGDVILGDAVDPDKFKCLGGYTLAFPCSHIWPSGIVCGCNLSLSSDFSKTTCCLCGSKYELEELEEIEVDAQ